MKLAKSKQCDGKIKHENRTEATKALIKHHGFHPDMNVYHCPHCDHYHVGHKIKKEHEV